MHDGAGTRQHRYEAGVVEWQRAGDVGREPCRHGSVCEIEVKYGFGRERPRTSVSRRNSALQPSVETRRAWDPTSIQLSIQHQHVREDCSERRRNPPGSLLAALSRREGTSTESVVKRCCGPRTLSGSQETALTRWLHRTGGLSLAARARQGRKSGQGWVCVIHA